MRRSAAIGWIALALLGLVVAAAVSLAASQLSSQRIGLASEPLTAGNRLVPRSTTTTTPRQTNSSATSAPSTTTPATTTPATTGGDDDSGRSRNRGRGGGDGDNDADD